MATVRIPEEHEYSAAMRREFEMGKKWFKIDYVPLMTRVLAYSEDFRNGHGRCSKRAMVDGALSRGLKETIAVATSVMNACEY